MTLPESSAAELVVVHAADRAGIVVRGKERTSWLNGLVTSDLAKRAATEAQYGLIVEKKGKIQTDYFALASASEDALVLAVPRELRDALIETLDHYLIMEDAELEAADLAFFHVLGRLPDAAAAALLGDARSVATAFAGSLDWLGLGGGAVVAVPSADADAFGHRLGELTGGRLVDEATFEALRIERGVPRFGVDFDATLYPQEASLERRAVAFDKGCYLGQEVVYMLENRGHVKRKLVALSVEGTGELATGDPVSTPDGTAVGEVKSSAIGPSGAASAIAMVKWAHTPAGTELRVGDRAARVRH